MDWGRRHKLTYHCGCVPYVKIKHFLFAILVQVMPQLLNHLEQDETSKEALDWSTLAVYSCSASCSLSKSSNPAKGSSAYVEEFVWVQPPS